MSARAASRPGARPSAKPPKPSGVTRQTVDSLVNERGGVSPEMAMRLAKALGSTAETWMRLQAAFDLAEVRKGKGDQIDAVRRLGMTNESI